eukprot:2345486-Rhodomonas_salina.6
MQCGAQVTITDLRKELEDLRSRVTGAESRVARSHPLRRSPHAVLRSPTVVLRNRTILLRSGHIVLRSRHIILHSSLIVLCSCHFLSYAAPRRCPVLTSHGTARSDLDRALADAKANKVGAARVCYAVCGTQMGDAVCGAEVRDAVCNTELGSAMWEMRRAVCGAEMPDAAARSEQRSWPPGCPRSQQPPPNMHRAGLGGVWCGQAEKDFAELKRLLKTTESEKERLEAVSGADVGCAATRRSLGGWCRVESSWRLRCVLCHVRYWRSTCCYLPMLPLCSVRYSFSFQSYLPARCPVLTCVWCYQGKLKETEDKAEARKKDLEVVPAIVRMRRAMSGTDMLDAATRQRMCLSYLPSRVVSMPGAVPSTDLAYGAMMIYPRDGQALRRELEKLRTEVSEAKGTFPPSAYAFPMIFGTGMGYAATDLLCGVRKTPRPRARRLTSSIPRYQAAVSAYAPVRCRPSASCDLPMPLLCDARYTSRAWSYAMPGTESGHGMVCEH